MRDAEKHIRQIRGVGDSHHLTLVLRDCRKSATSCASTTAAFGSSARVRPGRTPCAPATGGTPRLAAHPKRSTVGVRVPDHAVVQALLADLGEPTCRRPRSSFPAREPLNDAEAIRDALGRALGSRCRRCRSVPWRSRPRSSTSPSFQPRSCVRGQAPSRAWDWDRKTSAKARPEGTFAADIEPARAVLKAGPLPRLR